MVVFIGDTIFNRSVWKSTEMIRQVDKVSATGRFICLRFCIGIPSSLLHPHTHAYIIREFVSFVRPFQVINLCIFTQCIHDFLHKSINVRTKWYLSSQMSYFNHLTVHWYECMRVCVHVKWWTLIVCYKHKCKFSHFSFCFIAIRSIQRLRP